MEVTIEGLDIWGDGVPGSKMLPEGNECNSTPVDAPGSVLLPPELPPAHARPGETRKECWERLRIEARAAGMGKRDAYQYATREADRVWRPPAPEPEPAPVVEVEPPAPEPEPVQVDPPPAASDQAPTAAPAAPPPSSGGVQGLGEIPGDWPVLPPNASLAAEVAWVQGNRVLVVQDGRVDLSRALSPAPSYAALAWLETSVLYPSKFSDVTVKASTDTQDDQEDVRREKIALADVQALLAEATSASATS